MTKDALNRVFAESRDIVVVLDGKRWGLLIRGCGHDAKCGVQVHGEADIRWMDAVALEDGGGFLYEVGGDLGEPT